MKNALDDSTERLIEDLVGHYRAHEALFFRLGKSLFELAADKRFAGLIHSALWRAKDPEHLRDKLRRKAEKAVNDGVPFEITAENMFERINDLAGMRLLHLHTDQFPAIDAVLKAILAEEGYSIIEGPEARVWDHEYQDLFKNKFGIEAQPNDRLYTSVHYVVSATGGKTRTAEIQVRTLAEELWGEVDHRINYPRKSESLPVQEQIRVLARVVSSCTRLTDSIFRCVPP